MKDVIVEFDIGVDTLLSSAKSAKGALDTLVNQQKELTKSGDTSSDAFVKNAASIKNLRSEYNTYTKGLQSSLDINGKSTKAQRTLTNELDKSARSIDGARASNKELLAIRNKLDLTSKTGIKAQGEINKKIDENNRFIKTNVSELEKQKINIGNYGDALGGALDKSGLFGTATKELVNDFKNLITPINAAVLSTLGLVQSQNSSTVAIAKKSKAQAISTEEIKKGVEVQVLSTATTTKGAKAQNLSTAATTRGSKALRLFKIALISTGIGAIIVIIGSLVAAFLSTQKGIDAVNRVLAPLKGGVQGLISVFQELSHNIGSIVTGALAQFKDNFTILVSGFVIGAKKMQLAWATVFGDDNEVSQIQAEIANQQKTLTDAIGRTAERVGDVAKGFKNAGEAISDAAKRQSEIVEKTIELENARIRIVGIESEMKREIKEQNKIAEDTNNTVAEREAAAVKSVSLSKDLLVEQKKIVQSELDILDLKNAQTDTSREDLQERANKAAELNNLEASALELQTTQQNKVNTIRRAAEAAATKALTAQSKAEQESIKRLEISLKLFELQNESEVKNLEDKKNLLNDVLKKELEIIDAKALAGLSDAEVDIARIQARTKTKDEIEKIVEQEKDIERSRLDFKTKLIEQENQLEFNKESILKSLKTESRLLEATTQQEQAKIQLDLANQNAQSRIENEINNLQIEEEAKRGQKLEFEIENAETQEEKDILIQESKNEKLLRDLEFQDVKNIAFQELDNNYQIKKKELQVKTDLVQKISEEQTFKDRVSLAQKGATDLLTISDALFGKSKAAAIASVIVGRAASIAQIISNTGIANAKAAAASPLTAGQPFVTINTISSGLSIGASLASGAKAIGQINSAKAAKGISFQGTLSGASHANGGIDLGNGVEAEGGENMYSDGNSTYIMNKKASSAVNKNGLLGALSSINQGIGGGIPLSTPTNYANTGGLVQSRIQRPSSENQSNTNIAEAIAESQRTIRVVNDPLDTINEANDFLTVENEANL